MSMSISLSWVICARSACFMFRNQKLRTQVAIPMSLAFLFHQLSSACIRRAYRQHCTDLLCQGMVYPTLIPSHSPGGTESQSSAACSKPRAECEESRPRSIGRWRLLAQGWRLVSFGQAQYPHALASCKTSIPQSPNDNSEFKGGA